jgi:osmoprotectant transport system permease protein
MRHAPATAAAVQTVPSLALLALMVPILGALGAANIGFFPAFLALVLYTVLPVLRNTVTALTNLPLALTEAARGVGMNPWEQLTRVELPLGLPVIVAGIRTATVWTVGAATLATPVGADSLGNFIFSGLQTRNTDAVLVGCIGAATLALSLDGLGRVLLVGIERRSRRLTALGLSAFAALYVYAGAALMSERDGRDVLIVGAKTFTEQYILSELLAETIEEVTGGEALVKPSLGSSVVFDALITDAVDVYVDYSGTLWSTVMKRSEMPRDRREMVAEIKAYLASEHGVTVVAELGFDNSYALAMRRSRAEQLKVRSLGDLARVAGVLSMGADYEFFARPEWRAMERAYGLKLEQQRSMDPSLMYQAVAEGTVDVISAFSSDGRITAYDLVILRDELAIMPPYDALVLAGRRLKERHPDVLAALAALDHAVDAEQMRRMNLAVDIEHRAPADVARELAGRLRMEGGSARE